MKKATENTTLRSSLACGLVVAIAASATAQSTTFTAAPSVPRPSSAFFDPRRDVVTVFDNVGRTWEWDGTQFHLLQSTQFTTGPYSAFDSTRGVLARWDQTQLSLWDGVNVATVPAPTPPAMWQRMAYDEARQRIVGVSGQAVFEFDGAQWQSMLPVQVHSPGNFFYDGTRGACVMQTPYPSTLWQWNGSQWSHVDTAPPSANGTIAYDRGNHRLVLHGFDTATSTAATWERTAAGWQTIAVPPAVTSAGTLVFDGIGMLRVEAGWQGPAGIWRLEGATWRKVHDGVPAASNLCVASHPLTTDILAFGVASNTTSPASATWRIDGGFTRLQPITSPPHRSDAGLAYCPATSEFVLFGGFSTQGALTDTWTWNGTNWTQRFPAANPPDARRLVTDPSGGVLALRRMVSTTPDQWLWDGTNWTQGPLFAAPYSWEFVHADHDPVRNRVVAVMEYGNAWEWDGATWTALPARSTQFSYVSTYSPGTGELWFDGGGAYQAWNGASWRTILAPPWPAVLPQLPVPDHRRGIVLSVLHPRPNSYPETLATNSNTPATIERIGSACATGTAPGLVALGRPTPGNAGFALDLAAAPTQALFLLGIDVARVQLPLGSGCTVEIAQAPALLLGTVDATGRARHTLPIPTSLAFRGVNLFAQAAVLDPANSPIGSVTLTAALRVAIGD